MTEHFHEMLAFVLQHDAGLSTSRARTLASYFVDTQEFLAAQPIDFERRIRSITGRRTIRLSAQDIQRIQHVQTAGWVSPTASVRQNYLAAISRNFSRRQLTMIQSLRFQDLIPNPFLLEALGLRTPRQVVHMIVYMRAARSVVTSMGFFVERLLLASSDTVEKAPRGSGWDLVKHDARGQKHWIQAKSGPNDMDLDQVRYWATKIAKIEATGERAYIGITYGRRSLNTLTLNFLRTHLPDWELQTLIGAELWDFLADDPHYHDGLCHTLRQAASLVLGQRSFVEEIDDCVKRIEQEFLDKYGPGEAGVQSYLQDML